jgi:hypothetical protein
MWAAHDRKGNTLPSQSCGVRRVRLANSLHTFCCPRLRQSRSAIAASNADAYRWTGNGVEKNTGKDGHHLL